ncbi:AAA family ATPase [Cecembia calidifontis]|uniref:AAA ATPase-like protein n=1 Tax=Cecembia calidifontis TaxID=1187080 RepID=A0A4Q7PAA6_9BACT|nr:AAA family ATPase [Cecembia calidifontis]RZS97154.1 AAA ATPase-like protein [Cecembia calidifontis]
MAYIKTIGLEYFRLFKDKTVFDLAPITILTGTNSFGKSSLIKALQLIKSSIKETSGIYELNFSGGRHNLGWFGQVINSESENNELVVTVDFPFQYLTDKTLIDLTYSANSKESLTVNLKK